MDDITALLMGKNRETTEMAKNVMKKVKEKVEKKGLEMSVTESGKAGESKMTASCGFLENELRYAVRKNESQWQTVWKRWVST